MRWFKHDSDAHTDARLKRLLLRHGPAGYGLYWYCLELIAKEVTEQNLTFELEEDSELISMGFGMPREQVESAMKSMIELGLFDNAQGRVYCLKLLKRIDASMLPKGEMRAKLHELKDIEPWQNHGQVMAEPWSDHENKQTNKQTILSGVESGFQPPELEEVRDYFAEKGFTVDPDAYHDYNEANGWLKSDGKPIKSWKLNASTWQKNEDRRNADNQSAAEFIE